MRADRDPSAIRSYLLGQLPEPEAEALEHEYMARPEVWERVRGVEDDLLDDYAAGRLGLADRVAFEKKYLASPPLRERVMAARALRSAAGRHVPARPAAVLRPMAWRLPMAVAAGVLIAVAAYWIGSPGPGPITSASPVPSSVAPSGTPAPTASVAPPGGSSVVLALAPVLLRGAAKPVELRIAPGTDTVVLELEGDPALRPRGTRALELTIAGVDGGPTWTGEASGIADARRPSLLATARVPAARLPPADYVATLAVKDAEGDILHRYFLRVVP